ncbi:MAG TPA: hypothetical protein VLH79_12910 [Chthonomonadales bacterium]|nr:hypothetical protein [Chthonomonadales bacterium]
MPWYSRLQRIDNRWLYLALAVAVAVPAFVHIRPPIRPTRETLGVFEAVEQLPPGRPVLLLSTWDAGTIGECEGQFHAVVEHLMRRGQPFVVWTSNPQSPPFYQRVIEDAARRHGRTYGTDWADLGYKMPAAQQAFGVQQMARDFAGTMREDIHGTPVKQVPLLRDVRDATDFPLAISIGYNPALEFVQFVQAVYGTRVAFGVAAINSTMLYTYIDSRQIVGMLVGARGGAEYETLVGRPGIGVDVIVAQSFGHLLIIAVIVVANVAYLYERRTRRRSGA